MPAGDHHRVRRAAQRAHGPEWREKFHQTARIAVAVFVVAVDRARTDDGIAQRLNAGGVYGCAIQESASAARGVIRIAKCGEVADASHRFVFHFQTDQDSPMAVAAHEVLGAVDRVDDPASAALRLFARAFLAQYPIVGKGFHQCLADQRFALAIGGRNGRFVRFCFRPDASLLMAHSNFAGAHRDLTHESKFFLKRHHNSTYKVYRRV